MIKQLLFIVLSFLVYITSARVPLRDHEVEEVSSEPTRFNLNPDSVPIDEDKGDQSKDVNRISVLLFRRPPIFFDQPSFTRPSFIDPFNLMKRFHSAIGDPNHRHIQTTNQSESRFPSSIIFNRLFENFFPDILPNFNKFEPTTGDKEDKIDFESLGPNFEKKEKKVVIGPDGKKYLKTVFYYVSSFTPYDENTHDENGNEKVPKKSEEIPDGEKSSESKPKPNEVKPQSEEKINEEKSGKELKNKEINKTLTEGKLSETTSEKSFGEIEKSKENKNLEKPDSVKDVKETEKKANENEISDKNTEYKPEPVVIGDN